MRNPLIFAFKLHKWLGLLVGLQVLIWLISGLYMVAVDIDFIHGDPLVKNTSRPLALPEALETGVNSLKERYPEATRIDIGSVLGQPHYIVSTPGERFLIDAQTGQTVSPLDESAAREIARYHFNGDDPITRASMLTTTPPMEIQTRKLPLWRVDFDDRFSTSFYIDPYTGSLVTRRHQYWRIFDFFWMLHIMDYEQRVDAHSLLLISAQLAGLVLAVTGIWLLVHRLSYRRRQPAYSKQRGRRMMPFFKKLHKWLSLLIGLQVLLWLVSGLVISLLDPVKVSGRHWSHARTSETGPLPPARVMEPVDLEANKLAGATSISLDTNDGIPVYRIKTGESETMLDATIGAVLTTDKSAAEEIARKDFRGDGKIIAVTAGNAPGLETRDHVGAYWKVDFSDSVDTSIYVSAANGEIIERRNLYWRVRDFFWMLHIMDYRDRSDFNNALVILVAAVSLWLGISGLILLFGSFSRRDFRFLKVFGDFARRS